jgi:hypothetical protein
MDLKFEAGTKVSSFFYSLTLLMERNQPIRTTERLAQNSSSETLKTRAMLSIIYTHVACSAKVSPP